jgi:hypothetical protein
VVQRLGDMTRLSRTVGGAWNHRTGALSCGAARRSPRSAEPSSRCRASAQPTAAA